MNTRTNHGAIVPIERVEQPDPYAELKKAHAEGKMIQVRPKVRTKDWHDEWQDCIPTWGDDYEYRIKPTPTFQLPPPPPVMRWHREDGWQEGDLPQGKRPLVLGENLDIKEDEWKTKDSTWTKYQAMESPYKTVKPTLFRTRRPLTFEHAGKTWTYHRPGDPRPCDGGMRVACVFVDHDVWDDELLCAHEVNWGDDARQGCIIGWRYADEKKTVPLGPEDVPPGSVFRGAGEAKDPDNKGWCLITSCSRTGIRYWRQSDSDPAELPWKTLHESGSQINRSIPLTGKWNPDAWEPCEK